MQRCAVCFVHLAGYRGDGFTLQNKTMWKTEARRVYEAGVRDAALANARSATERSGIIAGASENDIALVERLSKALKRDILFVNVPTMNGETFNGCYSEDGKIYVNVNTKDTIVKVVAHEFTHSLESKGLYGTFLKFVFDTLAKEGKTKAQLLKEKRNSASVYKNKSDTELEHEVVAQFVEERLLTDERVMRDIVRTKGKSFVGKLHDILNTLIEKIKAHVPWTKAIAEIKTIEDGRKLLSEVIRSEGSGESGETQFSFKGKTKDGIRIYKSDFAKNVPIEERIKEFKKRIDIIFNLGAVTLKTDTKKILVRGDAFTAQKNIYGDIKKVQDYETEAKVSSLYDLVDILETSKYVPRDKSEEIEPSFADPSIPPKNKAHEDVKYWYKFKNTIIFDGVAYDVTFNIRDKGKEQYQYLIEFKEKKK